MLRGEEFGDFGADFVHDFLLHCFTVSANRGGFAFEGGDFTLQGGEIGAVRVHGLADAVLKSRKAEVELLKLNFGRLRGGLGDFGVARKLLALHDGPRGRRVGLLPAVGGVVHCLAAGKGDKGDEGKGADDNVFHGDKSNTNWRIAP